MKDTKDDEYTEERIWRDAWSIADPGAANPVAVARTLQRASSTLLHGIGTDGVKRHPALRLIAAQLASLYSVDSDGGSHDGAPFINQVKTMVDKLDRYQDVCLRCGAYNDFPCKEADIFTLDHEGRPKTQERDFSNYGRKVGQ